MMILQMTVKGNEANGTCYTHYNDKNFDIIQGISSKSRVIKSSKSGGSPVFIQNMPEWRNW